MTKQDIANFHGGPMPASIAAKMGQHQADLQNSEPTSYKNWLAQRQAELARRGKSSGVPPQASVK